MLKIQRISVSPALEGIPVELPLRVHFQLPDYVSNDPNIHVFNAPAALIRLLEKAGSARRFERIIRLHISAPGRSPDQVAGFVLWSPIWSPTPLPVWATEVSFDQTIEPNPLESGPHWIHHWTGRAQLTGMGSDAAWEVDQNFMGNAGASRDALVKNGAKLLILHNIDPGGSEAARRFGEFIAGGGGPAVVVVEGSHPDALDRFFTDFYAAILHNRSLVEAVQTATHEPVDVRLFLAENAEHPLDLRSFLEQLEAQLRSVPDVVGFELPGYRYTVAHGVDETSPRRAVAGFLHQAQRDRLDSLAFDAGRPLTDMAIEMNDAWNQFQYITAKPWDHEHDGVIPLTDMADRVSLLTERARAVGRSYRQVDEMLRQEADDLRRTAPRVLNANFADPAAGKLLGRRQELIAGKEYDLLVDVGPRWSRIDSLVIGNAEFPVQALPPGEDGWEIDVVLISEDFEPNLASARLWLPRDTGRSFPIEDGRKSQKSGPVALRVRAAPRSTGAVSKPPPELRCRLCLYYENNLLQSAVVRVGMAADEAASRSAKRDNEVHVDYVMSGTFQRLDRFRRRAVRFTPDDAGEEPVSINLTLNDDGADGHRIIIRAKLGPEGGGPGVAGPAAGWSPYNPADADGLLENARRELKLCFFDRGQDIPERHFALSKTNSKDYDSFRRDLKALAHLGNNLFAKVASQVHTRDGGVAPADWKDQLRDALADASVIQVARTGKAEYVLPWALVYDIPMPGPEFKFCPIVEEWKPDNGVRHTAIVGRRCPYQDEPFHQENVYCPYGLWGLKHIVEQPVSTTRALWEATEPRDGQSQIVSGSFLELGVSIARNSDIDTAISVHLQDLQKLKKLRLAPPNAALDVGEVRKMLVSPNVVYFICHGRVDKDGKPFLNIGAGGAEEPGYMNYRIYATTVTGWRDTKAMPNLRGWSKRRPLVVINGCHTCELKPSEMLSIASQFSYAGASGVVGTEVSVEVGLAAEVGESLLAKVADGVPLGQAIRQVRWDLANKGNLLGLAYTAYAFADLRVVYDSSPPATGITSIPERLAALGLPVEVP